LKCDGYIASGATFYRVLKVHKQLVNRTRSKSNRKYHKPKAQMAVDVNQVWTWDISYLPGKVKGQHGLKNV